MATYAAVGWRMQRGNANASEKPDVWRRMLTYADVCWRMQRGNANASKKPIKPFWMDGLRSDVGAGTYADVC